MPLLEQAVRASTPSGKPDLLHVEWQFAEGAMLTLLANLSDQPLRQTWSSCRALWSTASGSSLDPWQVVWLLDAS